MYFKFLKVTIVSFLLAVGANSMMAQETLTFTEGQVVTNNQEFHTSANVSIIIGSSDKPWNGANTLLNDGVYYCTAQDQAKYKGTKYIKIGQYPTEGCYYKLKAYVGGQITLKMAFAANGTKKLYVLPDDGTAVDGLSVTYGGTSSVNATDSYVSLTDIDNDDATFSSLQVTFTVKPYIDYYIAIPTSENLAFAGYTFTPDKKEEPSYTPYVHQYVTNISGITMMYGGWLTSANDILAKAGTLTDNGTENNKYTDNKNSYTDKWTTSQTDNEFNPLDGYTTYVSDCGNDAKNEQVEYYDYSTQGIASLPCRGTYYKFEPAKDGHLSVYLLQNGRIENGTKYTGRTLYFVDEFGVPQTAVYTKTKSADGIMTENNGYYINQKAATCYSFEVKAGKTYFLFANGTKLGLYGYTFGAAQTATSIAGVAESGYTYAAQDNATVTLTRTLLAGTWNSLVLPFSMNETQVRAAFGDDTQVYYYNGVASNKFKFLKHYYQVIQAGVPCLIVPSKVSSNNTYTIKGVTINSDATTVSKDGYIFTGTYAASTVMVAGSYFVGHEQNSTAARLYNTDSGEKTITGLRAYLKPGTTNAAKVTGLSFDDDNSTVTAIEDVTTDVTVNNGNIYNLSGQLVKTGATNLDGLDKGIYILNGKKYVVK